MSEWLAILMEMLAAPLPRLPDAYRYKRVVPSNAPYILEHVGAEDKRMVWLENSYHVATLENDKELMAEETLRFIQSHG